MDGTAIATYVLAFITGVLAFLNWRIIRENRKLWQDERNERLLKEAKDRKERFLNEIIDWGESIRKCAFISNTEELLTMLNVIEEKRKKVLALRYENEYKSVSARYTYIKSIASQLDISIQKAIEDVDKKYVYLLHILDWEYLGKTQPNDVEDNIDKLKDSVVEMIKVVASFLPK
jgi:hypothetical protein